MISKSSVRRVQINKKNRSLRKKYKYDQDVIIKKSPDLMIYVKNPNLNYFRSLFPTFNDNEIYRGYIIEAIAHQDIHLKQCDMSGGDIYKFLENNDILENAYKIFGNWLGWDYYNGLIVTGYQFNRSFNMKLFKLTLSNGINRGFQFKEGLNDDRTNFYPFANGNYGIYLTSKPDKYFYMYYNEENKCRIYDASIPDEAIVRIEYNDKLKVDIVRLSNPRKFKYNPDESKFTME